MDDDNTQPQPPPPASAAAAAPSSRTISEHLALTLQTIDQLTTIFSSPHHIATLAVETIGPEVVCGRFANIMWLVAVKSVTVGCATLEKRKAINGNCHNHPL